MNTNLFVTTFIFAKIKIILHYFFIKLKNIKSCYNYHINI